MMKNRERMFAFSHAISQHFSVIFYFCFPIFIHTKKKKSQNINFNFSFICCYVYFENNSCHKSDFRMRIFARNVNRSTSLPDLLTLFAENVDEIGQQWRFN